MKNNDEKIYSFIGLAMRAGKIVSGDDSTFLEMKRNKVKLVIVADDAYRSIPLVYFSTKLQIGLAIGKSPRAVLGIKDENFAKKIIELIELPKI